MIDHSIIMAAKATSDPLPQQACFYIMTLNSGKKKEKNTVIIVKQKVNVAFLCLSNKSIEGISQERHEGYKIDASQLQL